MIERRTWLLRLHPPLPDQATAEEAGFDALQPDTEREWPCPGVIAVGDQVFVLRSGKQPGLLAAGTVTQGCLPGASRDSTKRFLRFRVKDLRPSCADGFVPLLLLEKLIPGPCWSSSEETSEIEAVAAQALDRLWTLAQGQHAIATCVQALAERRGPGHRRWQGNYQRLVDTLEPVRSGEAPLTAELLAELWRAQTNGVTGVGPGVLPSGEFKRNAALLQQFTQRALEDPSAETLKWILDEWDERQRSGDFTKRRPHVIHRVFAAIAPARYTSLLNPDSLRLLQEGLDKHFQLPSSPSSNWAVSNARVQTLLREAGLDASRYVDHNVAMWELFEWLKKRKPKVAEAAFLETIDDDAQRMTMPGNPSLNQILYGPPGTGKTYATLEAALEILAPEKLQAFADAENGRAQMRACFNEFCATEQIVFCTFHQSFSYEDFVQGLKARTVDGKLDYVVEDGIFKRLCDRARLGVTVKDDKFDKAIERFRQLLENAEETDDAGLELKTKKGQTFRVKPSGVHRVLVFPDRSVEQKHDYIVYFKDVRRLYEGASPKDINNNSSYVRGVLDYLYQQCQLPAFQPPVANAAANRKFVLIIDEINRGNVSRIFGELITLIEPSKRSGAEEALSLVLPHSEEGERFSVPSNVYLIGTMNTADRSLAGLDLALRRRFSFREMPPKPELLDDVQVEGVCIGQLLRMMNRRIEVLLDRDHCIGHAYFMDMSADPSKRTLAFLADIFQQRIIPLLQEYFFEDWERIGWVLNDQQAKPFGSLPFITKPADEQGLEALFGAQVANKLSDRRWQLNAAAFSSLASYRTIVGQTT